MVAELGDEQVRRCSHNRSVHFPDDDTRLISGYHEAPCNEFHLQQSHAINAITDAYRNACERQHIMPNESVERQVACFHQVNGLRQECLSLKGQRLSQSHMECLEEILKRVQFDTLDFEYTFIDDEAAISLAEMLEFYDSTVKLNLSFNKQINIRGWNSIFRAIKNCQSLQVLNLRYTSLSERAVPVLTRTLRSQPSLTILHVENVSLSGKSLLLLVCALKSNTILKELYLGENNLQPSDGVHLHQLIIGNTSIQILDLRNNQLQDSGASHVFDALRHKDTLQNSSLISLTMWNNRMTSKSMDSLARALIENNKLETLNIGNNSVSVDGITALKPALLVNTSVQRLGLQATNLDCQCAIVLAECIADNKVIVRLDLRDNAQIGSAGLLALHLAMKMNTSITLLNLDYTCTNTNSVKVKDYNEEFRKYFNEIKEFCERNKKIALDKLTVQSDAIENDDECEETLKDTDETIKVVEVKKENEHVIVENNEVPNESENKAKVVPVKPIIPKQSSFELGAPHKRTVFKITRSSSLTCAELVEDISERIMQMSRSLSALDETSLDAECASNRATLSTEAPVNNTCSISPKSELVKSPSLPILSSLDFGTDSTATIKRKARRFSVSAVSASVSNPDIFRSGSPRFKVERVAVPTPPSLAPQLVINSLDSCEQQDSLKAAATTSAVAEEMKTNAERRETGDTKSEMNVIASTSSVKDISTELDDNDAFCPDDKNYPVLISKLGKSEKILENGYSSPVCDTAKLISPSHDSNNLLNGNYVEEDFQDESTRKLFLNRVDANSNETTDDVLAAEYTTDVPEPSDFSTVNEDLKPVFSAVLEAPPPTSTVKLKPTKKFSYEFGQLLADESVKLGRNSFSSCSGEADDILKDRLQALTIRDSGLSTSLNGVVLERKFLPSLELGSQPSHSSPIFYVQNEKDSSGVAENIANPCAPSTSKTYNADDEVILRLVKDLINFTVYEMGEEEHISGCSRTVPSVASPSATVSALASYGGDILDDVSDECDDEEVVRSLVRGLVRDVLSKEKETLRNNLKRKRERMQKSMSREFT